MIKDDSVVVIGEPLREQSKESVPFTWFMVERLHHNHQRLTTIKTKN